MKKRFLILIILSFIVIAIPVISESIDLSKYDDTALVELLHNIQDEIANRGIKEKKSFPIGEYICGKDFPAGKYILSFTTEQKTEACIWVYDPAFSREDDQYTIFYKYITHRDVTTNYIDGQQYDYTVDIKEGNVLKVELPILMSPFT